MARVSRVATDATKDLQNYQRELQRKIDYALRNISIDQLLLGLSDSLLVSTNSAGKLISVANLANWIAGTTNQITITDDGDGTITISTPQNIDTDADVTFDSITLDDLTASRMVYADANKKLVSIANLASWIAGTTNQITVTNDGDGTITISTPQDLHTGASVTFANVTASTLCKGATAQFGDVVGGNYSEFESDGTYKANGGATGWVDIDFPIIIRTTGAGIPSLVDLNTGLPVPQWQVGDFNMCEGQEMIHPWKQGSLVKWHIHMITNGSDVNDRYVKWQIDWCSANINGAVSATNTQSYEYTIPAGTASKTHLLVPIYSWTPTGLTIESHVYAKLTRIASAGTAPTSDPWCSMLQMHVECDAIWSRTDSSK